MIVGSAFLYGKNFVVSSKWYGKLATVIFYIAIVSSLAVKYFNIAFKFDVYIYYLALALTLFAFIMYVRQLIKQGTLNKEDILQQQKSEN